MVKTTRDGSLLFILTLIGNASSFLAQILFGRLLAPEDYGAYGTLLAVMQLLLVPLGAIQTIITSAYAQNIPAEPRTSALRRMLPGLAAFCAALAMSVPVLRTVGQKSLDLGQTAWIIEIVVVAILGVGIVLLRGICQGRQLFAAMGISYLVELTGQALIGAVMLWFSPSVSTALMAIVISRALTLVWLLKPGVSNMKPVALPRKAWSLLGLGVAQTVILGWAATWDLVWVRARLPQLAGYYAAAGMAVRIQVALAGVFAIILFPAVEQLVAEGKDPRRKFRDYGLPLVGLGLLGGIGMAGLGPWVVPLLFGKAYVPSVNWFQHLALVSLPLGWASVTAQFDVATRNWKRMSLLLAATAVYGTGLLFLTTTVEQLVWWLGAVWGGYLLVWALALMADRSHVISRSEAADA